MAILIIAEHNNTILKSTILNLISAALQLNEEITVWIIGYDCNSVAEEVKNISTIQKIIVTDNIIYKDFLAENVALLVASLARKYNYILAPASTFGKNILPRVAGLLDVSMVSDVIKIIDQTTFVRPMYAGNILATVQTTESLKILTIRSTAFEKAKVENNNLTIEQYGSKAADARVRFVKLEESQSERPELSAAKIIISGGRGLQSKEQFQTIVKIADRLKAAVGASRAAVDSEFVANDYQVGQTGKIVAPLLYIAVGISGAIQHVAGMSDSKIIVAINKDPDAPIFAIADYGLVADWFTLLPELEMALSKLGYEIAKHGMVFFF